MQFDTAALAVWSLSSSCPLCSGILPFQREHSPCLLPLVFPFFPSVVCCRALVSFVSGRRGGSHVGSGSGSRGSGACCASCSLVRTRLGVWLGWCLAVCWRRAWWRAWVALPGGRLVVPCGALLARVRAAPPMAAGPAVVLALLCSVRS